MSRVRRPIEDRVEFTSVIADQIAAYVKLRRSLGFDLRSQAYILRKFDRLLEREMKTPGPVTREVVEAFARSCRGLAPLTRAVQLSDIRQLCLFLRQTDPATYVPDRDLKPGRGSPRTPHIYTVHEIQRLLAAALAYQVRPRGSFRPETYRCLVALLYATGMRISEALALDLGDFDLREAVLHIRKTKFHKARLIPLATSTAAGLKRYLLLRAEKGHPTVKTAPFFVNDSSSRIPYDTAQATFRKISRRAGVRGPAGSRGPRLHDLRHTFAVHRLVGWYREGKNVQALLPVLSTYLGHAHVSNTQVYLHTTEELLGIAGDRFHQRFPIDPQPQGEQP